MYYYVEVNTEPLTLETDPIITDIKLGKGLLEFVDVGIPDWVSRLAKCRIFYNSIQILPWNRNAWLTGDNTTIRIPLNISLQDEPYKITIHQYNEDDTFPHQLSYGFSMDYGKNTNLEQLQNLANLVQVSIGG